MYTKDQIAELERVFDALSENQSANAKALGLALDKIDDEKMLSPLDQIVVRNALAGEFNV